MRFSWTTIKKTAAAPEIPAPIPPVAPPPAPTMDRAKIIESLTLMELFVALGHRLGPLVSGIQAFTGIVRAHNLSSPEQPEVPPAPSSEEISVPAPATAEATPPQNSVPSTTIKKVARKKVLLFGFGVDQEVEIRRRAASFDLELIFISQPDGGALPTIPVCDWGIVNRNVDVSRRAKVSLAKRPGNDRLMDAGTTDTALQKLADINSRR